MRINTVDFELTDGYQWVKTIAKTHYLVISGTGLPSGDVDFGYYDIDFLSDDIDIDQLDELITEYYSSVSDFFLASTDDDRQQQYQYIAEMIAEQEWGIEPRKTCLITAKEAENNNGDDLLQLVKEKMAE